MVNVLKPDASESPTPRAGIFRLGLDEGAMICTRLEAQKVDASDRQEIGKITCD